MPFLVKCLACKNDVPSRGPTAKGARKYCDNVCQHDFQLAAKFLKIRAAGKKPKGVDVKTMKQFLIASRGHKCKLCKLTDWRGKPIPLVMDHRDGNSDNWKLTNLRLICCNCDAQTDTYKSKNRGNGRHARRERYALGKSY